MQALSAGGNAAAVPAFRTVSLDRRDLAQGPGMESGAETMPGFIGAVVRGPCPAGTGIDEAVRMATRPPFAPECRGPDETGRDMARHHAGDCDGRAEAEEPERKAATMAVGGNSRQPARIGLADTTPATGVRTG